MKEKCIGFTLALLLKLWGMTLRLNIEGFEHIVELAEDDAAGPPLITFWHGHQIFMPLWYKRYMRQFWPQRVYALISEHGDGRIAAHTVRGLGIHSIAGSSTRGGTRAFLQLLKKMRSGELGAITPDGPKGPLHTVKPGVLQLAAKAQSPILPVAIGASCSHEFASWDKMILPFPFARVTFVVGKPIFISSEIKDEELEEETQRVETTLAEVTNRAAAYYQ